VPELSHIDPWSAALLVMEAANSAEYLTTMNIRLTQSSFLFVYSLLMQNRTAAAASNTLAS